MKVGMNNETVSLETKKIAVAEMSQRKEAPKIKEEKAYEKSSKVETKPDNAQLSKMVEEANAKMARANRQIKFELFEDNGGNQDVAIKVINTKTQEVVAEIPSEEMIEFSRRMEEVIEIPLCFSSSIQSDTAWRAFALPFTAPASWIPPSSPRKGSA